MRRIFRRLTEKPFVSAGLVGINVAVYLLNRMLGNQLLVEGNLNLFDVLINGEYGRILWSMFLHGDTGHLFNNMIILLFMGGMLERETGPTVFGSVYLLSGICGNLSSLLYKLMNDRDSWSIGASGAVFGLDGLLLALVLFSGHKMPAVKPGRVVAMIILSVYNGFVSSNIDNAAHVGGLFAGFVLGCVYCAVQRWRLHHNKE